MLVILQSCTPSSTEPFFVKCLNMTTCQVLPLRVRNQITINGRGNKERMEKATSCFTGKETSPLIPSPYISRVLRDEVKYPIH
jgi:hypothetical protein